jgi:integrative and conjugative element protein (TIGR02256 family)
MPTLKLTDEQILRFKKLMTAAGNQEIGGILVGEIRGDGDLFLSDFSVQQMGGTIESFVRDPAQHQEFLKNFFERTNHNYSCFNYLGEWHTHPLFSAFPSGKDIVTMQELVDDPQQASSFAILLVLRLNWSDRIEATGTAFFKRINHQRVELVTSSSRLLVQPIFNSFYRYVSSFFR